MNANTGALSLVREMLKIKLLNQANMTDAVLTKEKIQLICSFKGLLK